MGDIEKGSNQLKGRPNFRDVAYSLLSVQETFFDATLYVYSVKSCVTCRLLTDVQNVSFISILLLCCSIRRTQGLSVAR